MPGATEDTLLDRLFSYYGPQEGDKKGRRCLEDSPSDLEKPIWKSRADFAPGFSPSLLTDFLTYWWASSSIERLKRFWIPLPLLGPKQLGTVVSVYPGIPFSLFLQ